MNKFDTGNEKIKSSMCIKRDVKTKKTSRTNLDWENFDQINVPQYLNDVPDRGNI